MNSLSKVILLVDDSPTVRRMMEWALRPGGFRLLQAVDGIHALEVMAAQPVDMAIVDLNMPRMDGIELIKAIRADEKLKRLPIILLTTESREQDRDAGLKAGANLYLTKPSAPSLLLEKSEALLGTAPARQVRS